MIKIKKLFLLTLLVIVTSGCENNVKISEKLNNPYLITYRKNYINYIALYEHGNSEKIKEIDTKNQKEVVSSYSDPYRNTILFTINWSYNVLVVDEYGESKFINPCEIAKLESVNYSTSRIVVYKEDIIFELNGGFSESGYESAFVILDEKYNFKTAHKNSYFSFYSLLKGNHLYYVTNDDFEANYERVEKYNLKTKKVTTIKTYKGTISILFLDNKENIYTINFDNNILLFKNHKKIYRNAKQDRDFLRRGTNVYHNKENNNIVVYGDYDRPSDSIDSENIHNDYFGNISIKDNKVKINELNNCIVTQFFESKEYFYCISRDKNNDLLAQNANESKKLSGYQFKKYIEDDSLWGFALFNKN